MKDTESRRQFMKKGIAAGAGIMGLSNLDTAKALSLSKLKTTNIQGNIVVEKAEMIYTSEGETLKYNSFTNMDFWHGKYYVTFRQAIKHHQSTCRVVLLESTDLENWTETIVLDRPTIDDRDNKFLSTPERLILYTVPYPTTTEVMYTEDGVTWSSPVEAAPALPGAQFWKPKSHNGIYYTGADVGNSTYLLKSPDGINSWEVVSTITSLYGPTETSLVFLKDDRLLALVRINDKVPGATVGGFYLSSPPYTSWTTGTIDESHHFSGPAAALVNDTILVASRTLVEDWGLPPEPPLANQRTALYTFDVKTMSLGFPVMLPTREGGDSSYPGILPTGRNRAVMCWHDGDTDYGSEDPSAISNIWLAHIKIV